jgi:DNA-directed RNA polymerase subunit RPC12/RpoP
MPLTVPCLKCKKKFIVRSKRAGTAVDCPACGFVMVLPPLKRILQKRQAGARASTTARPDVRPEPALDAPPLVEPIDDADLDVIEEPTATESEGLAGTSDDVLAVAGPETVVCPHCGGELCYEPALAEQVVTCPYCNGHLQMPRL